ncbi:MAG TPA: DUF58 domain-containing protein [Blastocatellia bacterium]|jgi:uncharacterized protein (DUF58 family)|nr:DUF58 domain-containing protein [Blastocatellia bacterium]
MAPFLPRKKSFRFVFISALLTAAATGVALISVIAGQMGEHELASLGSKTALGLALVIVLYVAPRLAQNINFNSGFSVHVPNAGLLFSALILLVTILSLSSGNNLLYLVLSALLATMFVSWAPSRLNLSRIGVSVRFPNHIFAGESATFDLTVTNRGRLLPAFSLTVAMSEEGVGVQAASKAKESATNPTELVYLPIVPARASAHARIERGFQKRGVYPINGFIVHSRFPFGFIEQRRRLEAKGEIVVYPAPLPLDEFGHAPPPLLGRVEGRAKGSGSDLYAIRQYLSSDHRRQIDWKATAKTSQVMVREFTRDDDWRVTIIFDARIEKELASTPEFAEKFEQGVALAASLISHFFRAGVELRLITIPVTDSMAGENDSGFGMGKAHSYKMFYQLARIAPATEADIGRDPSPARFDDPFLIVIASASSPSHLNARAAELITFEEL